MQEITEDCYMLEQRWSFPDIFKAGDGNVWLGGKSVNQVACQAPPARFPFAVWVYN